MSRVKRAIEFRNLLNKRWRLKFWSFIHENPYKQWDWKYLSFDPNITWDVIRDNPNKPWDQSSISFNPNITWDVIENNLIKLGME